MTQYNAEIACIKQVTTEVKYFIPQNEIYPNPPNDVIMASDNDGDIQRQFDDMTKLQYVQKHHQRKISYLAKKDIWRTFIGDKRKEVTRRKKEDLISFLYNYYREAEAKGPSFSEVFQLSQDHKKDIENRSINTITRNWNAYHRFISDTFGDMEITKISDDTLKRYIVDATKRLHPTEKDLKNFIGVIRQTFKYAYKEMKILEINPAVYIETTNYYTNCNNSVSSGDNETFSPEQIEELRKYIWNRILVGPYDPYLYAILLSIETGTRIGELPPLRWSDITDEGIHIHRQQRLIEEKGKPVQFEELPYTKDERRHPHGGRYFPITEKISDIVDALKDQQDKMGIISEYIFARQDGDWISKKNLGRRVYRLCKKFGLNTRKNHAFRKSLNSNVLIPLGISAPDRAYLLGHSVETNLKYYSFSRRDRLGKIKETLDASAIHTPLTQSILPFTPKEASGKAFKSNVS